MEYIFSKNRNTPHDLVMELRINLIRVNNAFCERQMEVCGNWALNFCEMYDDSEVDLDDFLGLVAETEGVEPEYEVDEAMVMRWCEELVEKVKNRMAQLPPT